MLSTEEQLRISAIFTLRFADYFLHTQCSYTAFELTVWADSLSWPDGESRSSWLRSSAKKNHLCFLLYSMYHSYLSSNINSFEQI